MQYTCSHVFSQLAFACLAKLLCAMQQLGVVFQAKFCTFGLPKKPPTTKLPCTLRQNFCNKKQRQNFTSKICSNRTFRLGIRTCLAFAKAKFARNCVKRAPFVMLALSHSKTEPRCTQHLKSCDTCQLTVAGLSMICTLFPQQNRDKNKVAARTLFGCKHILAHNLHFEKNILPIENIDRNQYLILQTASHSYLPRHSPNRKFLRSQTH